MSKTETGRPSLRTAQREDTRRRLMSAGRELFRSRGVEEVAMEDVALAAKVSRATIYLHFAGKQALLEALLEEDWAGQLRLFERLDADDLSNPARLRKWVMRVAEGMLKARDSFAIHRAALGQNPRLTMQHQQHRRQLAEILLLATGEKFPDPEDRLRRDLEAELTVAELEYFATAAVLGWTEKQVECGASLVVRRLREFAGRGE
jgi:AcrR family transcriptional regulator